MLSQFTKGLSLACILLTGALDGAGMALAVEVGEKAPDLDFEIPQASQFTVGGFLSLSFNLNAFSSKTNN